MKCILIPEHGDDIDHLLTVGELPQPAPKKPNEILIKVEACALAPGDVRVMKGHCDYFQEPPDGFPYIPGGDISGTVEEADSNSKFHKGDRVLAMFEIPRPINGLAEYVRVKESLVAKLPESIGAMEGACLTSSAVAAYHCASNYIMKDSRVLILGASGGVGTFLVQMAKNMMGASYVAATSTDETLIKSLGADRVVNYGQENWWDITDYQQEPFDVIFDLGVAKYEGWQKACSSKCLKKGKDGGKYVTTMGDNPEMKMHNLYQTFGFVWSIYKRVLWTSIWPFGRFVPKYIHLMDALDIDKEGMVFKKLIDAVVEGKLKVVLDSHSVSSSSSTTGLDDLDAVKKAFHVMENRAAHGKIVIKISD